MNLLSNRFVSQHSLLSGMVVDNVDEKNGNRVKVAIDGISDMIGTDDLPFYPIMQKTGSANNATLQVPQIGTKVLVQLLDGTIYNGVVLYSIASEPAE